MVVPIKFGTLNLQRSTEVGVITATPRPEGPPMHPEEGKGEERREEERRGKDEFLPCGARQSPRRGSSIGGCEGGSRAATCHRERRNVWRRSQ